MPRCGWAIDQCALLYGSEKGCLLALENILELYKNWCPKELETLIDMLQKNLAQKFGDNAMDLKIAIPT